MGLSDDRAMMRAKIGTWGAWIGPLTAVPSALCRPAAKTTEDLGYSCLWYPEGMGLRESFSNGAILLGATERIMIASGIANVWARDAIASASASRTLNDGFGDRYLLGLGVSHPPQVDPRGTTTYLKPVAKMREYLQQIAEGGVESPDGTADDAQAPVHTIIAALRKPMLEVARDLSLGAHPYLVPFEHTARAREIMGPDPIIAVAHKAIIDTDADRARARARAAIAWYLTIENYQRNLMWMGFTEDDFANGGSDRLVDALVCHGDPETVAAGLRGHLDAGADHLAVEPLGEDDDPCGLRVLEALAPHLS